MPVYLRNFYYKKLIKIKKEEQEQIEKSQKKSHSNFQPNINPRFKQ